MSEASGQRDANKRAAQQIVDVWDGNDLDKLDEVMAEEVVLDAGAPEQGGGRDVYKNRILAFRSGLRDMVISANEIVAEDDEVVVQYTAGGTHEGNLIGIKPTGTSVEVPGFVLYRFHNGEVVEVTNLADTFGLFTQLGVVEPPGR